jgi:hypothetical protein
MKRGEFSRALGELVDSRSGGLLFSAFLFNIKIFPAEHGMLLFYKWGIPQQSEH